MFDHPDGEREREEMSSGSSSLSGSPGAGGGEKGRGGSKDSLVGLAGEDEEEEEGHGDGKRKHVGHHGHAMHPVYPSETETDILADLTSSHSSQGTLLGSGGAEPTPMGASGGGGGGGIPDVHVKSYSRNDSLGRGQKPLYHPMRKYGSSDSLSSQSTLVAKLNYEHDDPMAFADILRPSTGRGALTQSNVQDHVQSEARKHSRRSYRALHQQQHQGRRREREEEEEGLEYDYRGKGKEKGMVEEVVVVGEGGRRRGREERGKGRRRREGVDTGVDEEGMSVCLVCMYVCMFLCTFVCIHNVCVFCVCMYVCFVYVCMYVCMYVYVCVCMFVCMCVCNIIYPLVQMPLTLTSPRAAPSHVTNTSNTPSTSWTIATPDLGGLVAAKTGINTGQAKTPTNPLMSAHQRTAITAAAAARA